MKADTVVLKTTFGKDIQYVVPLFQRPYIWNQDKNWAPLWEDVREAVERTIAAGGQPGVPHFLGAVVLEQMPHGSSQVETRQVIDGQQRLTTLQVFLAAARNVADARGCSKAARLLMKMLQNDKDLLDGPESDQRFKVWPTNANRDEFRSVMSEIPVSGSLADAFKYFSHEITEWLDSEPDREPSEALDALVNTVRDGLSLVVIDLEAHDDAQMIFETLNYRGTPLLAADLVKNLLFRQVEASGADGQKLFDAYWEPFDQEAWRQEATAGRITRPRLDTFLWHWLTMRTRREITVSNLFAAFTRWAKDADLPPSDVFAELARYAAVYDSFDHHEPDTAEGRFFYRLREQQMTTVMPLLLLMYGLHHGVLSRQRLLNALTAIDSFLMRRSICGLSTKDYNSMFRGLLGAVADDPEHADDVIIAALLAETGPNRSWPTDVEFHRALLVEPLYQRLTQARIRLLLEGIEDELRTDYTEKLTVPIGAARADKLTIEHVMPQKWQKNWPLPADAAEDTEDVRNRAVHTLGNLTLLTGKLNPLIGNDGWHAKRERIGKHSLLIISTGSILHAPDGENRTDWASDWDEDRITARGNHLAAVAMRIWPRGTNVSVGSA